MTSFTVGLALAAALVGLPVGTLTQRVDAAIPPPTSGTSTAEWPVQPPDVLDGFEATTPYGPGHRGVDISADRGRAVRAVLPGTVTVAGEVAGRPVVVVDHGGGLRTTYLPVVAQVAVGDRVLQGHVLGVVARSRHCPVDCLHLGARTGEEYIDPLSLLPASGPVRLLPLAE